MAVVGAGGGYGSGNTGSSADGEVDAEFVGEQGGNGLLQGSIRQPIVVKVRVESNTIGFSFF